MKFVIGILIVISWSTPYAATSVERYSIVVQEGSPRRPVHVDWVVDVEREQGHFELCEFQGCKLLNPLAPDIPMTDFPVAIDLLRLNMQRLDSANFRDYLTLPSLDWSSGSAAKMGVYFATTAWALSSLVEVIQARLTQSFIDKTFVGGAGAIVAAAWGSLYLLYRHDKALAPQIKSLVSQIQEQGPNWKEAQPLYLPKKQLREFAAALESALVQANQNMPAQHPMDITPADI